MAQEVLIVEDNRDLQQLLQVVMQREGFDVAVAANGREALEKLSQGLQPCLILLDLMMPVMDGWTFLETCSPQHLRNSKVAVLSAVADHADARVLRERYDCELLGKPTDIRVLRDLAASCRVH